MRWRRDGRLCLACSFEFALFPVASLQRVLVDSSMSDEIQNPLVFQCEKCLAIISDSFSLVGSQAELSLFCVERASGVSAQSADMKIGPIGRKDEGCVYIETSCSTCKTPLGRIYKSTNSGLDFLRGRYSFSNENMKAYQLGSGLEVRDLVAAGYVHPESDPQTGQRSEVGGCSVMLTKLNEDVVRIQELLLVFQERLEELGRQSSRTAAAEHVPGPGRQERLQPGRPESSHTLLLSVPRAAPGGAAQTSMHPLAEKEEFHIERPAKRGRKPKKPVSN